jgi:hypothetical protein
MPIHGIHEALDSKHTPELQHAHIHGKHAKPVCSRVIMPGMPLLEILKAVAAEMVAVCWVSPGSHVGIMRSMNVNPRAVPGDTIQLIHEANHGFNVFDYMTGMYLTEAICSKRIGICVQIVNNVDTLDRIAVHAYGSCDLVAPAA